jgi:2-amino-4-hydroxy-6-hydroxymethyldihydropteridine diphosphokinase
VLAYLGLGSNLGDRMAHLAGALRALREVDPALMVSPVYESAPLGGPGDQDRYLNCVVQMVTTLSPHELLDLAHRIEEAAGRVRTVRFGPRTLDVDVLLVDDLRIDDPDLVVPHPRIQERGFVLAPLADLDPSLVPGDWRERLAESDPASLDLRLLGSISDS